MSNKCFDIPTPVLLIPHRLWSRDLLSAVSAHVCKMLNFSQLCLHVGM